MVTGWAPRAHMTHFVFTERGGAGMYLEEGGRGANGGVPKMAGVNMSFCDFHFFPL